jgi:hypothetical protein
MDTILEEDPIVLFGPNLVSFHQACSEEEFPIFYIAEFEEHLWNGVNTDANLYN